MQINEITGVIVDAAMKVHTTLGVGMLESAYEACLKHELSRRGLKALSQIKLPIVYEGIQLDEGYRIDLLIEDLVIIEAKTVERILPIHEMQLYSYLKMSDLNIGLIINFNVQHLKNGIKRIIRT